VLPRVLKWAEHFRLAKRSRGRGCKKLDTANVISDLEGRVTYIGPSFVWEASLRTLQTWARQNERERALVWDMPTEVSLEEIWDIPKQFYFGAKGWAPLNETRDEAQRRIAGALAAQLKYYLDRTEQRALKQGLERRPRSWQLERVEWLARYQVQGWSHNQISKRYEVTRPTVVSGIGVAASAVFGPGWEQWLRPHGKPGRPRGKP
jgi:hypothetical protein